jgi:hypothetical protein
MIILKNKCNNALTHWYKNRPPIRISKGARKECEDDVGGLTELYVPP